MNIKLMDYGHTGLIHITDITGLIQTEDNLPLKFDNKLINQFSEQII
jgi:hypothetical protein